MNTDKAERIQRLADKISVELNCNQNPQAVSEAAQEIAELVDSDTSHSW